MNALASHDLKLRRLVGLLGIALPFVLPIGLALTGDPHPIRPSISAYHATAMRDFFVGLVTSVGTFLFAYQGYDEHRIRGLPIDRVVGTIASLSAALVAFCPAEGGRVLHVLHLVGGTGMFGSLAYFSLFLFTRGGPHPTRRKRQRNVVYRVAGVLIVLCMALMGVYWIALVGTWVDGLDPEFWLEAVMLVSFGVSWMVKGEVILRDR